LTGLRGSASDVGERVCATAGQRWMRLCRARGRSSCANGGCCSLGSVEPVVAPEVLGWGRFAGGEQLAEGLLLDVGACGLAGGGWAAGGAG